MIKESDKILSSVFGILGYVPVFKITRLFKFLKGRIALLDSLYNKVKAVFQIDVLKYTISKQCM
ncbi:MAG: hypothetical protein UZ08_BCD001002734 [Candidatus Parvibacillus calidus]|nr:MAG: hypothetical protein UZ08_BCD001002734 [Candidatus Parvibacillus calidus]